ncbi:glycerophosphodiester phosphodiesterase [Enhygromyxa salina]|uniref:Glycerophosphoryl diester phosphodiesterase n=1 Tax=Enhygromyxa salina TaxID=215803 RepID=A0A2S9YYN4_9BACT|nr:glycerophosphodiester phosphodiesterase [Enhygromyxa salina]PRQ10187.1 Glycerophosphoryl diester phosphodiesterase [Enhygromyxa salina]
MRCAELTCRLGLILLGAVGGCGGPAPADSGEPTSDSSSGASEATTDDSATETGLDSETGETGETGEPPGNPLLSDELINIAHRGGRELRPEATLPAFETALTIGADVLEFDVHASSDGVIVVMHDDTVDRTTDGTGLINQLSFDQLRLLDAGYRFTTDDGATYPFRGVGIQIPTPAEIFAATPGQYYMIEIKQAEPSIVPAFIDELVMAGVEDHVVIASFDQVTLDEVRATAPEILTSMSAPEMIDFYSNGAEPGYEPPAPFMQVPWEVVNQELIDLAKSHGIRAHPWTVNSQALMVDMIGYGVDGIITDDPELLDGLLGG